MRPVALTDSQRAELFLGLGRALEAGLPPARALQAMAGICDGVLDTRLRRVAAAVGKGTALARALDRQGLLGEADHALLAAGEHSGHSDRVCRLLARRFERSAARWRQLRGRLMLPAAVLVAAILVLPLPALAAGRLSLPGYVLRAGALLAALALAARLVSRLARHWRASGTPGWLTAAARWLPWLGRLSRLHERAAVCERLALALRCGMPAAQALDALHGAEGNAPRRRALLAARSALGGGNTVADALERAGLLNPSSFALVSTGEDAGRLDETLARVAEHCYDALDDAYALLAQWIPVAVYLLVALAVAAGLIG